MHDLNIVNKLNSDEKSINYGWPASHIIKAVKNSLWVNGVTIYKNSLKFTTKVWCPVVRHQIIPIDNRNTLGVANAFNVKALVSGVELNIPRIIEEQIQEKMLLFNTKLPFTWVVNQLMQSAQVSVINVVDQVIQQTKVVYMALIKDMCNPPTTKKMLKILEVVRVTPSSDIPMSGVNSS